VNESALGLTALTEGSLKVWPTLAGSQISFSDESADATASAVTIRDAGGKVVLQQQAIVSPAPSTIDISSLVKGSYFIIFEKETTTTVRRFIKQ